ncbi:MAG: peptidoglycan DD-metalloendopeptidase family protein [Alcanivorax sp.]|uniref:M23 family metallopeptidase n=1 Tax=Alloalcanivorax marinus TaxID=1177169 RepID=UPI00195D1778|nr:M23 family metallopeptidase [Alloalcanivorax marinus]MBM7332345.1 peptidoglycan DD-metalloendopeptidase family protein [Alloalcanivorax marinus]
MNIILLNSKRGHSRTLSVPRHLPVILLAVLMVVPVLVGVGAYWVSYRWAPPSYTDAVAARFQDHLDAQAHEVSELKRLSEEQIRALTLKLADAQARLTRLDALGERLVDVAGIDSEEFDFGGGMAVGGPETEEGSAFTPPSFLEELSALTETLERREQQLNILENLLADRHLESETFLAGRPIVHGWMSSRFGRRADPFSGKLAWHGGVDFAGKDGSDVVATAAGVVTFAGERTGYGKLVEINHGNGISTRYGHAKEVRVNVGDIVRTGDVVALMGSTGRSTGPHVHYEVLKDGRQVNPHPYIYRARR